jgi:hypothetical protein
MLNMDVLDLIIQIQSFVPIFQRKKYQLVSKLWFDAYFIALKSDNSKFIKAYHWWKNKKINGFGSWFDPNDKNIITLAYSNKLFGEVCYHKNQGYLLLVSRIFKLAKILLRWWIYSEKTVDCLFVEKDYQLNIYVEQTTMSFVDRSFTDAILINLETEKIQKFARSHFFSRQTSNYSGLFFHPIIEESPSDQTQKYSFVNNGSNEHFLMNTSIEILKMGYCLHLTDHEENENGILISLWPTKQKFLIPSAFKLKSVSYVFLNNEPLAILLCLMDQNFFSILVNDNHVGFYKTAIFFDDSQSDAIDSNGKNIDTIELIDNEKKSTTILDSNYIQKLLNT